MFQFATATRIVFGAGALAELPSLARPLGRRAWLVLGRSERHAATASRLLEGAGARVERASVTAEPTVQDIVDQVRAARAFRCDLVVALGGGSVLDAGKAVAALLANPGEPLDYLEVVGGGKPLTQPSLPFVAIPTTAGTGAEVTKNAVLASSEHGVKVSLRSDSMLPRLALVDPELTLSLPPDLTASTGLDALTQVLEPFVSRLHNPLTDALSREALRRGPAALRRAFHDGQNLAARTDLSLVSLLGGLCLANARLGAVHGFAGPLGGMFPAPHGAVCARLLPAVVEQNIAALRARDPGGPFLPRYAEVAQLLTGRADATAEDAVPWLRALVDELGVPPLARHGVGRDAVDTLVEKAQRSSSMQGNPIVLTRDELRRTLEAAL